MRFPKLIAALAFAVSGSVYAQNISIATGGTGGVYYPMGGGLAAVLSKHVGGMQATAEVTGGSVDNLNLIASGKPYVGFSMVDAALDAAKGEGKFSGRKVDLRTLLVLYPNRMHVVSTEATGVKTMKDLKGKRVSTGSPGSATEVMALRLIEAAGLDPNKDMTRERLGVAESVNALKDKMDPRKVNGGVFLGLDGVVIKSHGGMDATGFSAAVDLGYEMVRHDLMAKIRTSLSDSFGHRAAQSASDEASGDSAA